MGLSKRYHYVLFLIVLLLVSCKASMRQANFEKELFVYVGPQVDYSEEVLQDFIEQLEKLHTVKLVSNHSEKVDISFSHIKNGLFQRIDLGNQDFYINAKDNIEIATNGHPHGFQRAVYYLLKKFGYSFLWHGEHWVSEPESLLELGIKDTIIRPKINSTFYGGTGGFNPYNYQGELIREYQRRNFWRIGDYSPASHTLANFYKNNKAQIDAFHKRGVVVYNDIGNKKPKDLNFDEPATLQILIEHFRELLKSNPQQTLISVSPPDGIGSKETLPKSIPQITNVGEKHWWWIKQVAEIIAKEFPDVLVMVNAYGNGLYHAKKPSFDLPKNLVVQIVPDAFQDAYDTRQEMYEDWKTVSDKIFYRGYINITQWSKGGLPDVDLEKDIYGMATEISKLDLVGVSMESTYFIIMAPHFYVLSNLWTGYSDNTIDELYDEWFESAFPVTHQHIENIFIRWGNDGFHGETDIAFMLEELNKALQSVDQNSAEMERIMDLMIYSHYLVLYYQAKKTKSVHSARTLEDYAKYMNQRGALQTKAVYYYDYGKVKPYGYGGYEKHAVGKSDPLKGINNNRSDKEIRKKVLQDFTNDLDQYKVKYSSLNKSIDIKQFEPAELKLSQYHKLYRGTFDYQFYPEDNTTVIIETSEENAIQVFKNGKEYISENGSRIEFDAKTNNLYKVEMTSNGFLSIKSNIPLAIEYLSKSAHNGYGFDKNSWYMWVPEDAEEIVWKGKSVLNKRTGKGNEFFKIQNDQGEWVRLDFTKKIGIDTYLTPTKTKDYNIRGKCIQIHNWVSKWEIINFEPIITKLQIDKI